MAIKVELNKGKIALVLSDGNEIRLNHDVIKEIRKADFRNSCIDEMHKQVMEAVESVTSPSVREMVTDVFANTQQYAYLFSIFDEMEKDCPYAGERLIEIPWGEIAFNLCHDIPMWMMEINKWHEKNVKIAELYAEVGKMIQYLHEEYLDD